MLLIALLLAPTAVTAAVLIERRLGASAAGWVAALPIGFSVAVLAVSVDAGAGTAGVMAFSAAGHVPAQVAFGVVFAAVLVRRGLPAGLAAGVIAYVGVSLVLAGLPIVLGVAAAVPALALAPRLMARGRPRPATRRGASTTAMTGAAAAAIVGAAVLTSRLAGPELAGAVTAFPTISTAVALAVVSGDGAPAGAHSLTGLVRSLPCYLAFCLVIAAAAPAVGPAAVALGLLACAAAAGLTWRGVALAPPAALAR
jgi:hypothetical protein